MSLRESNRNDLSVLYGVYDAVFHPLSSLFNVIPSEAPHMLPFQAIELSYGWKAARPSQNRHKVQRATWLSGHMPREYQLQRPDRKSTRL